jgi:hypothetical protein
MKGEIELCLLVVGVLKNTLSACLSGAACTGEGDGEWESSGGRRG